MNSPKTFFTLHRVQLIFDDLKLLFHRRFIKIPDVRKIKCPMKALEDSGNEKGWKKSTCAQNGRSEMLKAEI